MFITYHTDLHGMYSKIPAALHVHPMLLTIHPGVTESGVSGWPYP